MKTKFRCEIKAASNLKNQNSREVDVERETDRSLENFGIKN